MEDRKKLVDLLNCNEVLHNNIDKFIEVFVSYYGEDYREYITNKFMNTFIYGYQSNMCISNILHDIEKIDSEELYNKLLSNIKFNVNREDLFENNSLEYSSITPLGKLSNIYDELLLSEDERYSLYHHNDYDRVKEKIPRMTYEEFMDYVNNKKLPEYLKDTENVRRFLDNYSSIESNINNYNRKKKESLELLNKLDNSIILDNIEDKVKSNKDILNLINDYRNILEEYNNKRNDLKKYYDICDYNRELKSKLSNKYYEMYLLDIVDLLPDKINDEIKKKNNGVINHFSFEVSDVFGSSLQSSTLIDSFTEESFEILNNSEEAEWKKDNIKEKQIKYFNACGYYYGSNYDEYLKHKEIWPAKELVDKLINSKNKYNSLYQRDYYCNAIPSKNIIDYEKNNGYLDFNIDDVASIFIENMTCVSTNVLRDGNGYKEGSIVSINFDTFDKQRDHFIVHELNHLFEYTLTGVKDNRYYGTCGWDDMYGDIGNTSEKEIIELDSQRDKRSYELFNEIINEKIAKEISQIMISKNMAVFGSNDKDSYMNATSYDRTNYLVDDFFKLFKKEILESRRNNQINIIYDAVGKDNFDELNKLFYIHNEAFGGFKVYNMLKEVSEGKDTNNTRLYHELINRKNEIIGRMQEHYLEYCNNNIVSL